MFREQDTQIGTLKVRTRGKPINSPALCRRLSYLLNTVNFRVAGMSPSGILVVRHLVDPFPGKFASEYAVRVNVQWEQATNQALQEKYRMASRPVQGYIPPDAEAVFFEDEGQMVAALALDISRQAGNQWWWKVILRDLGIPPTPDLKPFLSKKITLLPAILHHLAEWNAAPEVVNKLSPDQAGNVLRSLGREYRLDQVLTPVFLPGPKQIPDNGTGFEKSMKNREEETVGGGTNQAAAPPWQQWLPSHLVPSQMSKERNALLGIGLSLYYKPVSVRTSSFIQGFNRWWQYMCAYESNYKNKEEQVSIIKQFPDKNSIVNEPAISPPSLTAAAPEQGEIPISEPSPMPLAIDVIRKKSLKKKEPIGARIRFDSDREEPIKPKVPLETTGILPGQQTSTSPGKVDRVKEDLLTLPGEGIETRLGGVFYLINLITRLGLLTGFRETCQWDSQIGPWGVLELLAKVLLEGWYQDLETDPLWRVLAQLDGRETGLSPGNIDTGISQWLETILPGIRSFLRKALGPLTKDNPEPEKAMLVYQARIFVTSTHVDIVMSLEDISLPVRMAGLDRDPGWIPEFVRIILFHFV